MKRTSITHKLISGIAMLALLLTGGFIGQSSSHAAGNTSIRWDQAGSSGFAWALENKAANADVANFVKYFTPGVNLTNVIAQVGSTLNFKFVVKNSAGAVMANSPVTLVLNPGYTFGTAVTTYSDGRTIPTVNGGPNDGMLVALTTDSTGTVSFTLQNKDTVGQAAIPNDGKTIPAGKIYTQLAIWQGSYTSTSARASAQTTQDIDILEIHFLTEAKAPAPTPTPTPTATPTPTPTATPTPTPTPTAPPVFPSMRLVSPAFGPSNSVDTTGDIAQYYSAKTRAFYTYIAAGTTLSLKYLVTKDGTTPLANTEVTLQVNAPYSNSKATWLSGSTKIGIPASESASGYDLKGTTNAAGEVTFNLKNTNTTGTEAVPASPNAMAPKVRLYSTLKAVIPGYGDKDADVDLVTFDIYAAPKVVAKKTTITCVKGKTTKKVTAVNPKCPAGYKKK
jgi:hypothetical protein